jgi:hypothetical protein
VVATVSTPIAISATLSKRATGLHEKRFAIE